jgi:hypothetical protein
VTWGRPSPEERRAAREAEREANMRVLAIPSRSLHRAVMGGSTRGPAPKSQPYRDPVLLEIARGRPCLLMVPAVCTHRVDQTVACHSNLSIHGKAGARKADDCYSVWGCAACHFWLDFGRASAAHKERAFMEAHARQVLAWRLVAMDVKEPERFRRAARRALERLNATPIGEPT